MLTTMIFFLVRGKQASNIAESLLASHHALLIYFSLLVARSPLYAALLSHRYRLHRGLASLYVPLPEAVPELMAVLLGRREGCFRQPLRFPGRHGRGTWWGQRRYCVRCA